MKILLFGASGQLGQDIQKVFSEATISCYSSKEFNFLSDEPLVVQGEYDLVINCMAMNDTGGCESKVAEAYKLNSQRVGEIAKLASEKKATFFHFSTDYVFDGIGRKKYSEEDLPNPVSVYGSSKLAGEYHAKMYNEKTFVFRVSSLFGVNGNNFVKSMLSKAAEDNRLTVVNDQFMSPTHSLDVAKAVKLFMDQDVKDYGVYHVSNSGVCSWFEFTQEIMEKAGKEVEIKPVSHTDFPAKLKRPEYSPMANDKVSKLFNMPKWEEALDEFLVLLGEKK
jgi:dTDP-4-dehydrorhamnose reductase